MDLEQLQNEYNNLKIKFETLLKENEELKEHLKKYTSPERGKRYYQNHREELITRSKEYKKKTGY